MYPRSHLSSSTNGQRKSVSAGPGSPCSRPSSETELILRRSTTSRLFCRVASRVCAPALLLSTKAHALSSAPKIDKYAVSSASPPLQGLHPRADMHVVGKGKGERDDEPMRERRGSLYIHGFPFFLLPRTPSKPPPTPTLSLSCTPSSTKGMKRERQL